MARRRAFGVTAVFTLAYVIAVSVGREALVIGDSGVSLATPAAGVAALWFVVRAAAQRWWVDALVLTCATALVLALSGSNHAQTFVLVGATLTQVGVFCWLLRRWCPRVWAGGGRQMLRKVDELWLFLAATGASSLVSVLPAAGATVLDGGAWSWQVAVLWFMRNTVSILVIVPLGLVVGSWIEERRRAGVRVRWQDQAVTAAGTGEYLAAIVLAPVMYAVWFVALQDLPLAFPLITLTIWAGARLRTRFVVLHDTVMGVTAIAFTVAGMGPFASIGDRITQVVVAQAYVAMVAVIGLALALARDERNRLVEDLNAARRDAESQAVLLLTIVDTMSEGVSVVDAEGETLLRNPAARRLLGAGRDPADRVGSSSFYGLRRLDGTVLDEGLLPSRMALAGNPVRETDLLVQHSGEDLARVLRFSSTVLPSQRGAVTVMRDVTLEREELERAAYVQASLLPAHAPVVPGYEVASGFVPARTVGGDFYDWRVTADGLVVTLADVMGKGMGAAILAAACRTAIRGVAGTGDVAASLAVAERALHEDLAQAGAFVTAMHLAIDLPTGALSYADAGHGLTLVRAADGGVRRLTSTGLPLGIRLDEPREVAVDQLEPGALLVTFSDGVLDAMGGSIEDLGRLDTVLRGAATAQDAVDGILAVAALGGELPDDLTVVAVRRSA
ncbi:SpoIIE family protein phosphatase [Actinotalea sp. BY-33]|uniref:SpoIIE family protein phosphatase n=1 Tax=Actinotalea soli TaxID=2819234 RepID=A0A939LX97_9CELL|nr:SpoIIE family protein phosphatase [Actinotalea soli]MBO1752942.1 SpoIIE family protein phosphatase [Actinotalea soli]